MKSNYLMVWCCYLNVCLISADHKTYKPIDVGGVAGGQKYIVDKMFVKFASDVYSLYGGDENAAKAVWYKSEVFFAYH